MSHNGQNVNYLTALGLQQDPFSPEPDSSFYYSFDSFEQRLKVLQGMVQGADLFVLVIGEPGSGKTTLLNRYLDSTGSQWQLARIQMDPESTATPSASPRAQRTYPAYILPDSANPIVIVDDAHHLPRRELDFLIHDALVPGSSSKIKRLVLFGESDLYSAVTEIVESLSSQPAYNKIYLPGLTEAQIAEYLQHRLAISGYTGKNPFDPSTISRIHRASGGFPGPINEAARHWLNDKFSDKTERQNMSQISSAISPRMLTWSAAGIIVLLLAALWLFFDRKPIISKAPDQKLTKTIFRKKIVQPPKSAASAVKIPKKPPAEIKAPPTAQTKPASEPPVSPATASPDPEKSPAPVVATPPAQEKPAPPAPVAAVAQKTGPQPKSEPSPAAKPAPKPELQPATTPAPKPDIPPKPELQSATKPAPKPDPQPKPEPPPPATPAPKTGSPPKIALQAEPKPAPKKPDPAMTKTAARQIRREQWLLSQDADFYTIQIMGVSTEKSMMSFINENQLLKQNEIAYFESTYKGKPWFQALFGLYPTKKEARQAADKLPENIQWAGPWIRKLSEVQEAITE